jgi:hypothetical protein
MVAAMLMAAPAYANAAGGHPPAAASSFKLDARSCASLRQLTLRLEDENHVAHRAVDCIVRVRTGRSATGDSVLARGGLASVSAAAVGCQGFWRSYDVAYWLSGQVNVGLCSNGRSTWTVWGPDCGVGIWPVYAWEFSTTVTWCGVYANGAQVVQPGENFKLAPYLSPWWTWYACWVRFTAGPSGGGVGMNYGAGGC